MKKATVVLLAFVCICNLIFTSCSLLGGSDKLVKKYAGKYEHVSSGLLTYGGATDTDRDCWLRLDSNKKGTFKDESTETDIKWHAPDEKTEEWMQSFEDEGITIEIQIDDTSLLSFLGLASTYVGYMNDDGELILYTGPADDGWTCLYCLKKMPNE